MTIAASSDLRARRDAVVDAHIEAEAVTHDIAAALATFHHPRYEVPAVGAIADGPEAVTGLLGQLLGAFPDFWLKRRATHHADDARDRGVYVRRNPSRSVGRGRSHRQADGSAERLDLCLRRRPADVRESIPRSRNCDGPNQRVRAFEFAAGI